MTTSVLPLGFPDPSERLEIIFRGQVEGLEIRKRLEVDGQDALIAHQTLDGS